MMKIRYAVLGLVLALACSTPTTAGLFESGDAKLLEQPSSPRAVPKAWGRLASVVVVGNVPWFYFEATDGTIRRAVATPLGPNAVQENAIWLRK